MNFFIIFALNLVAVFAMPAAGTETTNGTNTCIVNGVCATSGKLPFQVGLERVHGKYSSSWCWGVLIANNRVLTAAHCSENVNHIRVFLGSVIREHAQVIYDVYPSDIIIHPGWKSDTNKKHLYDMSLIRIPLTEFSECIQPVALPNAASAAASYVGQPALTSGWGYTSDYNKANTTSWQLSEVLFLPNSECKRNFGDTFTSLCVSIDDGFLTCNGDSGGPLVLEGSLTLVGIVSFDYATCVSNTPAPFTEIDTCLRSIEDTTIY